MAQPLYWRAGVALFAAILGVISAAGSSGAADVPTYNPIVPRLEQSTVVLSGHDLTVDQVISIARYGAKVALSAEARERSADAYGLLLEGAAEGVPIYWFNRGVGDNRETVIFKGDATAPANRRLLETNELAAFRLGARMGAGPELPDEEIARAMMAVRANTMSYEAASPALTQMLLDLLNNRISSVVRSRGTVGEGDLAPLDNVAATMVGAGDAYYRGVRMPAAEALRKAGLKPLQPFAADDAALTSTNAFAVGQAALLVADAESALDWADLIYAMDLDAMNSSVTPLSGPVQSNRPFRWVNEDAARVLALLKGSYLFDADPARIIQDPESMRASSIRQGAARQAWAALRDDLAIELNSSDHNPAIRVGVSPQDSWELNTPQLLRFYVHGGALSHGHHGFILSNANWDPYPFANEVEAFTIALANLDVAVAQRIVRFTDPFFTVVRPSDLLNADQLAATPTEPNDYLATDLWQEIASLTVPVSPGGYALYSTVEDLEGQTRIKVSRARQAVDLTMRLLGEDLISATFWLDLRHVQKPERDFGAGPTAAWHGFRQIVPWQAPDSSRPDVPIATLAYRFLDDNPARHFIGEADVTAPPAH